MCGRYNFTRVPGDEKMEAIHLAMEKNYPGAYKTGEIFPGDTVPAVLDRGGKLAAVPAIFGFPGYQDNRLGNGGGEKNLCRLSPGAAGDPAGLRFL